MYLFDTHLLTAPGQSNSYKSLSYPVSSVFHIFNWLDPYGTRISPSTPTTNVNCVLPSAIQGYNVIGTFNYITS